MANESVVEDQGAGGGEGNGEGGGESTFVEVDGQRFVPDESDPTKAKVDGEGNPIPYTERQRREETPEAKRARLKRELAQHEKKHNFTDEAPDNKNKQTPESKKGDLDYGQKAYLIANGIKDAEDIALVQDFMKNTGKDLEGVIASKHFQAELKEAQELRASSDAIPEGSRRSGQSARNTVEYWIAKGELPPADQVELRRKVVNAKMKAAGPGSPFSGQAVVGG